MVRHRERGWRVARPQGWNGSYHLKWGITSSRSLLRRLPLKSRCGGTETETCIRLTSAGWGYIQSPGLMTSDNAVTGGILSCLRFLSPSQAALPESGGIPRRLILALCYCALARSEYTNGVGGCQVSRQGELGPPNPAQSVARGCKGMQGDTKGHKGEQASEFESQPAFPPGPAPGSPGRHRLESAAGGCGRLRMAADGCGWLRNVHPAVDGSDVPGSGRSRAVQGGSRSRQSCGVGSAETSLCAAQTLSSEFGCPPNPSSANSPGPWAGASFAAWAVAEATPRAAAPTAARQTSR